MSPVAGAAALSVVVSGSVDHAVLHVAGELDLATAPQLRDAVAAVVDQGVTAVVVDLARLAFVDSSGVAALAAAVRQLGERGGRLSVRSVPPRAARVFAVTGLDAMVAHRR